MQRLAGPAAMFVAGGGDPNRDRVRPRVPDAALPGQRIRKRLNGTGRAARDRHLQASALIHMHKLATGKT